MDNSGTPSHDSFGFAQDSPLAGIGGLKEIELRGLIRSELRQSQGGQLNTNINRFVPGGQIVGPNANQRGFVAVVSPNSPDRHPIRSAINEANRLGGGKILIKSGTYSDILLNGTSLVNISLYSNIELVGEDNDTTAIDFTNSAYAFVGAGVAGTPLHNIHIENLNFINGSIGNGLLNFDYVDDLSVSNCHFGTNNGGLLNGDINITNCNRALVEGCYSLASTRFIAGASNKNYVIRQNLIENSGPDAISTGQGTAVAILNNIVRNYSASSGIDVAQSSGGDTLILGNIIENDISGGVGISVASGSATKIIGNDLIKSGTFGMAGYGIQVSGPNSIIANNHIRGGTWAVAVQLLIGANGAVVCGNNVASAGTGVEIGSTVSRYIISSNYLYGASGTTISDLGGASGTTGLNITA